MIQLTQTIKIEINKILVLLGFKPPTILPLQTVVLLQQLLAIWLLDLTTIHTFHMDIFSTYNTREQVIPLTNTLKRILFDFRSLCIIDFACK